MKIMITGGAGFIGSALVRLLVDKHDLVALYQVVTAGRAGRSFNRRTFNISAQCPKTNLEVVRAICCLMDEYVPMKGKAGSSYLSLIKFVEDRPGHDFRYELDASGLRNDLHWKPSVSFEAGLRKTVKWYLDHKSWWQTKIVSV